MTAQPGSQLRLWVLGALRARNGDLHVHAWPTRQVAALLVLLALQPQQSWPREQLAAMLWPDAAGPQQRNRLRNALARLRKCLWAVGVPAHSVVVADRRYIRLQAGALWCDAVEFERLARIGRLDAARELYVGPLLPEWDDEWVQERRARLSEQHDGLGLSHDKHASESTDAVYRIVPGASQRLHGRERELAGVLASLSSHRLVTITGFGGVGKTRLAGEVATRAAGFDGVLVVAMEDCDHLSAAGARLRSSLELPPPMPGQSVMSVVLRRLASRRMLLVLDNLEQLQPLGVAAWLNEILAGAPALHVLATSRTALRCPEEFEWCLSPLPVPPAHCSVEELRANPAVALFVDLVQRSRADFHLIPSNAKAVARLVTVLDGLPLALELAAPMLRRNLDNRRETRTSALTALVEAAVHSPSTLVRTGSRAAREPERASLMAVLRSTMDMLSRPQRSEYLSLVVFRGSFTAGQAMAIFRRSAMAVTLEVFVQNSLLRRVGKSRFALLPIVRELLVERGPIRPAARLRHAVHFAERAQAVQRATEAIDPEDLPNFEQAFDTWCLQGKSVPKDLLNLLTHRCGQLGRFELALDYCYRAGIAGAGQAEAELVAELARAWVLWRRDQNGPTLQASVVALHERSISLQCECSIRASAARLRGIVTHVCGDASLAMACLDDAHEACCQIADEAERLYIESDRIGVLIGQGQYAQALQRVERASPQAKSLGNSELEVLLENRACVCWEALREFDLALAAAQRCARLAHREGMRYHFAFALWNQARPLLRLRHPATAARLLGYSKHWWVESVGPLLPRDERHAAGLDRIGRLLMGRAAWEEQCTKGRSMSEAEVAELAIS